MTKIVKELPLPPPDTASTRRYYPGHEFELRLD